MSFGQNFAYSKTKEQDIAYMLAANVCISLVTDSYIGARRYRELLQLDGPIHVLQKQGGRSHRQPRKGMGEAHGRSQNHRCHPKPQGCPRKFFLTMHVEHAVGSD